MTDKKNRLFALRPQTIFASVFLLLLSWLIMAPARALWLEPDPGCDPEIDPGCAGSAPLNVSAADQTKDGKLTLKSLYVTKDATVEGNFRVLGKLDLPDESIGSEEIINGSIQKTDLGFDIDELSSDPTFNSVQVTNGLTVVNGPASISGTADTQITGHNLIINNDGITSRIGHITNRFGPEDAADFLGRVIADDLYIRVDSTFGRDVFITRNLKSYKKVQIGTIDTKGELIVGNPETLGSSKLEGTFTLYGKSAIASDAYIGGNLTVAGDVNFSSSNLSVESVTASDSITTVDLNVTGDANLPADSIGTPEIADNSVTLAKTNFVSYSGTWDPPSLRAGEIATREFDIPAPDVVNVGDPVLLGINRDMNDFITSAQVIDGNKVRVTIWLKFTGSADLEPANFNLIIFKMTD